MRDNERWKKAIVKIFTEEGEFIGTGFFVSKQEVATCAHVLTSNGKIPELTESYPDVKFFVNRLENLEERIEVEIKGWGPNLIKSSNNLSACVRDLAILKLKEQRSEDCHVPELEIFVVENRTSFRAFGFPQYYTDSGQWAMGRVDSSNLEGYVQITCNTENSFSVQSGYSGTPVWNDQRSKVLGIVSKVATDKSINAAYMIPVETLRTVLEKLNIISPLPPPLPNPSIKNIVEDFIWSKNRPIIPFLGPGINSSFYIALSKTLKELVKETVASNLQTNQELLLDIIGFPCSTCHYFVNERNSPPNKCPMIDEIGQGENTDCRIFDIKNENEQDLIVAKTTIRCLSQYLFTPERADSFYRDLRNKYQNICDTDQNPGLIHKFFAELPGYIQSKGYDDDSYYGLPYPLIVTTTYDNCLEKAFDSQGIEYDVVFYELNDQGGQFKHKRKKQSLRDAEPMNEDYNNLPIGLPYNKSSEKRPIIVQLFGRWDSNFIITDNQFNNLIKDYPNTGIKKLPKVITSILKKCHPLFIGYSPNDDEIQDLIDGYLKNKLFSSFTKANSWLVCQSSSGKLAIKFWEYKKITLLEISSWRQFISDVKTEISRQI